MAIIIYYPFSYFLQMDRNTVVTERVIVDDSKDERTWKVH